MSQKFVCHCGLVAVPAVIEGRSVLVCRYLPRMQGSQYRVKNPPCNYELRDETDDDPGNLSKERAAALYRKPEPFRPRSPSREWGPLAAYTPKNQAERALPVEEPPLLVDHEMADASAVPFLPEMDETEEMVMETDEAARLRALLADERQRHRAELIGLERKYQDTLDELARTKQRHKETTTLLEREIATHKETKRKWLSAREDLHRLRRSVGALRLAAASSSQTSSGGLHSDDV